MVGTVTPRVLGPSWHGYLNPGGILSGGSAVARRLTAEDLERLRAIRGIVSRDEWAEGGFEPLPDILWGISDDEGLAAIGNMTDFGGVPADVGILTRPYARGCGLATALATSMCLAAPDKDRVLRYRALVTNTPSLRVARRIGFVGYGSNIAVRE